MKPLQILEKSIKAVLLILFLKSIFNLLNELIYGDDRVNEIIVNQQKLSSLEVAEMVEKEHSKLLRDIRRYTKQLGEAKIGSSEFWTESTYVNSQNKEQPCYQITKKGCEFIAHKTTGTKGTIFTARYINRFHEMEEVIKTQQPLLKSKPKAMITQKSWFGDNNWKIQILCEQTGWERKYLYHKILRELSDGYNLPLIEQMYINHYGESPKYALDLVEYSPSLQRMATNYIDYLLKEIED